jgi:predicted phage replisome organizer
MDGKRYYWLKLYEDFFESKRIKKLRKLGETCLIIYLKMQLKSLKTDGVIEFAGVEEDIVSELALDLNEPAEYVKRTLDFLLNQGLCECFDGATYTLPFVSYCTGSETAAAQRSREYRQKHRE